MNYRMKDKIVKGTQSIAHFGITPCLYFCERKNGHHFFAVQNTIFEQNSGVPMRIPNIQGVMQNGETVVFRT